MTILARLTQDPDGSTVLESSYDRSFVEALKVALPWDGRSWDPSRKRWVVTPLYAPALVAFLTTYGAQVRDDRTPVVPDIPLGALVAGPPMPEDLRQAFDTLTLAYTAPLGLANAAFKFYARFSDHDDAGGSVDFRAMNDAIQTIRRYLDPKEPEEFSDDDIPF